jgi:hypothetical protein
MTGLWSTFFIWNIGVMFHFEKVRFDQCLQALFHMFQINWQKGVGGR